MKRSHPIDQAFATAREYNSVALQQSGGYRLSVTVPSNAAYSIGSYDGSSNATGDRTNDPYSASDNPQRSHCCNFLGFSQQPWKMQKTSYASEASSSSSSSSVASRSYHCAQSQEASSSSRSNNNYTLDTVTDGEKLLASELQSLTLQDREQVYEDIHGATALDADAETKRQNDPDYVKEMFDKLHDELQSIRKKDAYTKAAFLSPFAVQNETLRLRMLQSSKWKAKLAAQRMVKYFHVKHELFGEEGFVRPIRWSDLDTAARWMLRNQAIVRHEAATTDVRERSVLIFNFARFPQQCNIRSILQALWYINATVPKKSMSSQKHGMVTITNTANATTNRIFSFLSAVQELTKWGFTNSMPMRMTSNHICFEQTAMKPYISLLLLAVSQDMRVRTKFHFGSSMEVSYELAAYGVPSHLLESLDTGNILAAPQPTLDEPDPAIVQQNFDCDEDYNRALQQQQPTSKALAKIFEYEDALWKEYTDAKPADLIFRPGPTDVVLGRGWPYQSYQGNVAFTEYLDTQRHRYENAPTKLQRTVVTSAIAAEVQKCVRFLKRDGLFWRQLSESAARQKISMSLRNLSRQHNPKLPAKN